jgi:protein SCO1/2
LLTSCLERIAADSSYAAWVFSSRIKLVLIAALGLLLAAVAIWAVSGSRSAQLDAGYEGALMPPNVPVADFQLTDQAGRPVSLGDLKGAPSIITFLYTECKDVCPVTAQQIRGAMDSVGHDVPVVAISADPTHDTPTKVNTWLGLQSLQGRMRWGLGTPSQVQATWQAWGVAGQTAKSDHSAYVFLLDRDGRRCVSWPTSHLTPEGLAHDLRLLISRDGVCR